MSKPSNDNGDDPTARLSSLEVRLSSLEASVHEMRTELNGRRRRAARRSRCASEQAYAAALRDPRYQPTELRVAEARRALERIERRRAGS